MKQTMKILQCDTPSQYSGRIYPKEEMQKAVDQFNEQHPDGEFGTLGAPNTHEINLADISHKTSNLRIVEDGSIYADVEVLETPAGDIVKAMLNSTPEHIRLSPNMAGIVVDEMRVTDCQILHTSFLKEELTEQNNKEDNNE